MNPDKLFDYLEGRLSATERTALEEQLISDKQLQRELAVALRIHAGMRGDSREVLLPPRPDVTEQGRKTALRASVATAPRERDRKSTRLNSSHQIISYA